MTPLYLSAPASEELTAAIRWYESRRLELGSEFYDAVVRTFDRIQTHHEIGTLRTGTFPYRRLRVARFPYIVAYRVREHDIYVVAIAHASRRPDYWKDRR